MNTNAHLSDNGATSLAAAMQGPAAKAEFYLLCVLLFVLPTMEAPKTLALVLYLLVWIGRRFSIEWLRRFRPDVVEISLLAIIAASTASTAVNWPYPNGIKGLRDMLRYVPLFWCLYRAGYSNTQHYLLANAATWGLIMGLGVAVVELMAGRRSQLELHSAGVLTQSAIYVAIGLILAFGMVLTRWLCTEKSNGQKASQWAWIAALTIMTLALLIMSSRGAWLAAGATVLLIALTINRAKLWMVLAVVAVLAGSILLLMLKLNAGGAITVSIQQRLSGERQAVSNLYHRENMRLALAQFRQGGSPWFGIGPRNYGSIDRSHLSFDPPLRLPESQLNHAHNLFLTKLVEEGVIGLAAFLFFLGVVAHALATAWRRDAWCDWRWFAALGALAVPVIAGSVNTPFSQEHAMLAMALMGVYMAAPRRREDPGAV